MSFANITSLPAAASLDDATVARGLMRLARTGAYARPESDVGSGPYQVLSPRNGFAEPIAIIPAAAIAAALARG